MSWQLDSSHRELEGSVKPSRTRIKVEMNLWVFRF